MILTPPYYAGWGEKSSHHSGDADFDTILDASADSMTGRIYTLNQNYIHYPGDSASQLTQTRAAMQFFFLSPVSGQLRIVATLQCLDSYYNGSMVAEWGVTDATMTQESTLSMLIPFDIHANTAKYPLVSYSRGDDDGTWYSRIAGEMEEKTFAYEPGLTFTAGQGVVMNLLIFDNQRGWMNDMKFSGNITNYWFIRRLDITSA
jgi:hypothetical protein